MKINTTSASSLFNMVQFEWALRDMLQGKRGVGIMLAVAAPFLFVTLVSFAAGRVPADEVDEVLALMDTTLILPPLVAIIGLFTGGAALRQPLEDGTLIYFMTRPAKRMAIGLSRGLAVASVSGFATLIAGGLLMVPFGKVGLVMQTLPGLFVGGFALGALYGFILSLHRWALGAVLIHAVVDAAVARVPFAIRNYTISWHAWGGMFEVGTIASREGFIPPGGGGNVLVPILMGVLSLLLIGLLYDRKGFHLGVAVS